MSSDLVLQNYHIPAGVSEAPQPLQQAPRQLTQPLRQLTLPAPPGPSPPADAGPSATLQPGSEPLRVPEARAL